jgi:hypothetical protein
MGKYFLVYGPAPSTGSEFIHLVTRALGNAGDARRRAALRLIPLNSWGLISESEKNLLADALWHTDYTSPGSLPK